MKLRKTKNKFLALFLASLTALTLTTPTLHANAAQSPSIQAIEANKQSISQHGFKLKKSFSIGEHNILEFQHEKSGMWLVVEKNNNIDKRFEIMVRTPPENDKGINHIIEHCVLNGSKEYPCKNILWELHQMSYNTFLNALTWPCHTAFPVASIDEDELFSLAKIYTSGVFHPAFLEDKRIFKKEGIRFELDSENKLIPNGTVFNEMQGNNQDMVNTLVKTIFPDTQSKNVSGGLPEKIIDLSYEEVCETYKKYYHPSNMVAYMSGDINYERFMKFLDEEYLKDYDRINLDHVKYTSQDTSKLPKEKTSQYYKQATDKNVFSSNVISLLDYAFYIKNGYDLDILTKIINQPNSERVKYLKNKGYLDVVSAVFDHFYDPTLMISLNSENKGLVSPENTKKVLKEVFEKYPIKQSEIDAVVGTKDFDNKLSYATNLYDYSLDSSHFIKSFVKFGDPCSKEYFSLLAKSSNSKCIPNETNLNNLVKEIMNNKFHKTILLIEPSDDKSLSNKERLNAKIDSLQNQKDILTQNYNEQKNWAEAPNSEENRSMLKKMFKKLSQINTPKLDCKLKNKNVANVNCYHSSQKIEDFVSYKLVFSINNLSKEELQYFELLCNALNNNNTKKHSREELNKLKSKICQISILPDVSTNVKGKSNASIIVDVIADKKDINKTKELILEQLFDVDFKDIHSLKKHVESANITADAVPKPITKYYDILAREFSPLYNYMNAHRSCEQYQKFYKEMEPKLSNDKFINELSNKLTSLRNKIFSLSALKGTGICSSERNQKLSEDKLKDILKNLSKKEYKQKPEINLIPSKKKNIACIDPSTSNNNIICVIDSKELCNSADFDVTCRLVSDKFLAPKVREKSGAYGAGIMKIPGTGKIIISSNCDPKIKSTIDIFKSIPKFIKNLDIEKSEIENVSKSLLGQVFPKNKLGISSSQIKNQICSNLNYCKQINSDVNAIKNITKEKIKKHGELLEKAMPTMRIYVVSSDRKNIEEKMFDEILE